LSEEKKTEIEEIRLDLIDIGPLQSRTRKVEENTDELAENIRCLGLINPIMVYKKEDGRYDLVAGQRRLIAVEKLGWKTIRAQVLPSKPTDAVAKAISLSENIFREKLSASDIKDSIIMLYHRCEASARTISKTLGIPYRIVLDTIKYEALPDELKKKVDEGLDVALAEKAAGYATLPDGSVDIEKALKWAPELKTLMPSQMKKLELLAKERPTASPDELLEEAKEVAATKRIVIEMLLEDYEGLKKAAVSKGMDEREAAYLGLRTWLKEEGFLP
jgi:ParB family chromosome partitioning protein